VVASGVALGARRLASWRAGGAPVAAAREEQGEERRERAREREKREGGGWERGRSSGGGWLCRRRARALARSGSRRDLLPGPNWAVRLLLGFFLFFEFLI
jgi:hypothetical protein